MRAIPIKAEARLSATADPWSAADSSAAASAFLDQARSSERPQGTMVSMSRQALINTRLRLSCAAKCPDSCAIAASISSVVRDSNTRLATNNRGRIKPTTAMIGNGWSIRKARIPTSAIRIGSAPSSHCRSNARVANHDFIPRHTASATPRAESSARTPSFPLTTSVVVWGS